MRPEQMKILLVEDNPHEAELTIRSLTQNNIANDIVHVDDGADALDLLFSKGKHEGKEMPHPMLILLDLNLPRVSGLEILKQLKAHEQTRMIPVVVLTSSAEDRDIIESYKLGVNSYIVKPVNFDSFAKAIADLRMYWLVLNTRPSVS